MRKNVNEIMYTFVCIPYHRTKGPANVGFPILWWKKLKAGISQENIKKYIVLSVSVMFPFVDRS